MARGVRAGDSDAGEQAEDDVDAAGPARDERRRVGRPGVAREVEDDHVDVDVDVGVVSGGWRRAGAELEHRLGHARDGGHVPYEAVVGVAASYQRDIGVCGGTGRGRRRRGADGVGGGAGAAVGRDVPPRQGAQDGRVGHFRRGEDAQGRGQSHARDWSDVDGKRGAGKGDGAEGNRAAADVAEGPRRDVHRGY